ncbi:hypothetical protein [Roseateles sp. LYH14W]|uniref:Uncharacterized protein n=1 Tax=Pelomonas parva TaxID=3299032 RepID=A0ABW7F9W7_9BURK
MLSPFAIKQLIRYFDSIDRAVVSPMVGKRPKDEEYLTELLIDLLDEEVGVDVRLDFPLHELRATLSNAGDPLDVSFSLETHKHPKKYENLVSQADIGLIVRYQNYYEPSQSGQRSWLLQAKRLFPDSLSPLRYSTISTFKSKTPKQQIRIEDLAKFINLDSFRYLLYCPRPNTLDADVAKELAYHRNKAVVGHIYDYAYGQALYDEVAAGGTSIGAGIFVANHKHTPANLGQVHSQVMRSTMPLSWFLLQHIPHEGRLNPDSYEDEHLLRDEESDIVSKIACGDPEVVDIIASNLGGGEAWNGTWLPHATMTITMSIGTRSDRPNWNRRAP